MAQSRWNDQNSVLLSAYDSFASKVEAFCSSAVVRCVSYSGGVPGMEARLHKEAYEMAKEWLTAQYGEPVAVASWHPSHTKGIAPLRFQITPTMKQDFVDHINLIHMMQRKNKQYVLITWM